MSRPAAGLSVGPSARASRAAWLVNQETRALLTRLDRVRPFVLQETMVPAAAPMPAAQAAIDRYLIRGRRVLRQQVRDHLRWLAGPGGTVLPSETQRRFTVLKLQFNSALSQLDLFSEAISQRSEHETGVWLAGLDVAAQDALALHGLYRVPPVVCHLHGGIGGAIRRARTRLPGGGESPVAIVKIPRERMIGFGIASSLAHECGHQGAALLGLVESLRASLRDARAGLPAAGRASWTLFERWISEVLADTWALGKIGIASTLGLIGIVSLPRSFVFRLDPEDPHPFPWARVKLSCAIGNALYPHRQWQQLTDTWTALYPVDGLPNDQAALVQSVLEQIPAYVRRLLEHRPRTLGGRALGDAFRVPGRTPDELLATYESWIARPRLMRSAPPTLVFAVFGRARIAGRLSPEAESRQLGSLLAHWAVHSTLDLMDTCAIKWSARVPAMSSLSRVGA